MTSICTWLRRKLLLQKIFHPKLFANVEWRVLWRWVEWSHVILHQSHCLTMSQHSHSSCSMSAHNHSQLLETSLKKILALLLKEYKYQISVKSNDLVESSEKRSVSWSVVEDQVTGDWRLESYLQSCSCSPVLTIFTAMISTIITVWWSVLSLWCCQLLQPHWPSSSLSSVVEYPGSAPALEELVQPWQHCSHDLHCLESPHSTTYNQRIHFNLCIHELNLLF